MLRSRLNSFSRAHAGGPFRTALACNGNSSPPSARSLRRYRPHRAGRPAPIHPAYGYRKPSLPRQADTQLLVHQQQIGMFFLSELNCLAFTRVKHRQAHVGRCSKFPDLNPIRRMPEPRADGNGCCGMIQFLYDGGGKQDTLIEGRKQIREAYLDQVIQRRRVRHHNDHQRGRPLASSCRTVSMSCSRSSTL